MTTQTKFWQVVEQLPGLAAPEAEWRERLGNDWEHSRKLLRPTAHRAEVLMLGDVLHRVVDHTPDRCVVVPEGGGSSRTLDPKYALILEADPRKIQRALCVAQCFEKGTGSMSRGVFRDLGTVKATSRSACPVHLCLVPQSDLGDAIRRLILRKAEPMVILTPRGIVDDDLRYVLRFHCAAVISLSEAVGVDTHGELSAIGGNTALESFAEMVEVGESGPAKPLAYVCARVGDVWWLTFGRETVLVPHGDASGLQYIQQLLARPHVRIGVAELDAMVRAGFAPGDQFLGDEVLDRSGAAQLRRTRTDLTTRAVEAKRRCDHATARDLDEQAGLLDRHLKASRALHGGARRTGDSVDRLRSSLTKLISRTKKKVHDQSPSLAAHLNAIKCGRTMAYIPDTEIPWEWAAPL